MRAVIKNIIKIVIIWIVFLSIMLFSYFIYNGIYIDKLSFKTSSFHKIFFKFNGQLTLHIDEFRIFTTSDDTNKRPKKLYKYLLLNLSWLENVSIKKLIYNQDTFSLLYNKKILRLQYNDNKIQARVIEVADNYIKLVSTIKQDINDVLLDLDSIITIFPYEDRLLLDGTGSIFYKNEIISIPIQIEINSKKAFFSFKSKEINSIDFSKKLYISDNESVNEWVYDRVKCSSYVLNNFSFELNENFELDEDSLDLNLYCKNAIVKYHDELDAVLAQVINISIKNKDLGFEFLRPNVKDVLLDGSEVFIRNLFDDSLLQIVLKSNNIILNKDIRDILQVYDVGVPLRQLDSFNNAQIDISMALDDKFDANVLARVDLNQTNIEIIDAKLSKIKSFYIDKALISINNSIINISDINISDSIFEASNVLDIKIDTLAKTLNGVVSIDKLSLYEDKNNIESIKSELFIDFNKEIIEFADLGLFIDLSKDNYVQILANDLEKLKLKSFFGGIFEGNAKILLYDKFYDIQTSLKNQDTSFMYNGLPLTDFSMHMKYAIDSKSIFAKDSNSHISVEIIGNNVDINVSDIDINMSHLLKNNVEHNDLNYSISIDAKNTKLYYDDYAMDFPSLEVNISNDLDIYAHGVGFSSENINQAIGKDIFNQGSFDIVLKNEPLSVNKDIFYGSFSFKDAYVKNINIFANIFSFLNLSVSGFGSNGLKVNSGKVSYIKNKNKLLLNPFSLLSDSVNIIGKGVFDLDHKELNFYIKTSMLKTLSSVIKSLPIVDYIFLGDNNDINLNMIIEGKLGNLSVSLDNRQDIITQPFEMVFRVLSLPNKLIKDFIKK